MSLSFVLLDLVVRCLPPLGDELELLDLLLLLPSSWRRMDRTLVISALVNWVRLGFPDLWPFP